MSELLYPQESYAIVGACFNVYNEIGCGFLEVVYQECLDIELRTQGISFVAQPNLALAYRGQPLMQTYQPDFVCFDKIVVELKTVESLADAHRPRRRAHGHRRHRARGCNSRETAGGVSGRLASPARDEAVQVDELRFHSQAHRD